MDAVQEILKRSKQQQQQQQQQHQQHQQEQQPQVAQQPASTQHWEHDVPRQVVHAPVPQRAAQPQTYTPQQQQQQFEPDEINPIFRPPTVTTPSQAPPSAWAGQSQPSNHRPLASAAPSPVQSSVPQQSQSHNGQSVQQLSAQPPSPPDLQDPFVRQGHNQRRSSKPLQRASIPQQQPTPQPPPQQQQTPQMAMSSPVASGVAPSTTYYSPNDISPHYSNRESQQHQHHPQHPNSMPPHHVQPPLQPAIPAQQQVPQQQHPSRAQYERVDSSLSQGRVNSPSQPHYQTQQTSYSRRASSSAVAPSDTPHPMQLPPRHRNIPPPMDRESVTIFMEDFRAAGGSDGEPEHLLAEVVIPLRTSATHEGYWANAQELVDQLQLGPSRIDGPAKVFCRRGKYKHCFMRMSDSNEVECQPSSLQISPELSIQITIEHNNAPHSAQFRAAPYHVPSRKSPRRSLPNDVLSMSQPVPSRESMPIDMLAHSTQHHHTNPAASSPQLRAAGRVMSPIDLGRRRDSGPMSPHLRKRSVTDRGPDSPTAMVLDMDERPAKRPSITSLSQTTSGYTAGQQGFVGSAHAGIYNSKAGASSQYGARPGTAGGHPHQLGPNAAARAPPEGLPSPPAGSSDGGTRERTPTQSLSNPNSHNNLKDSASGKEPASPTTRGAYDEGMWRAPRAQVNTAIANWLKPHIMGEEGYSEFMHSKGHVLSAPQLLRVYGFALRQIAKWNNQRTPEDAEGCPLKKIGKSNVLQALGRQTSWGSDCEQTMTLVDKYGPGGPRENERVVALVNGKIMPGEKEGSVYFLQVLREVDREWRAANVPSTSNGSNESNATTMSNSNHTDDLNRKASLETTTSGGS